MSKLGLIGGLGPESTVEYYQSIISAYQKKHNSNKVLPHLIINSIDMYQVFAFIESNNTQELANYLIEAVNQLEAAGATYGAISANTPHIVFDQVNHHTQIPLISIVEETIRAIEKLGLKRVGLIGTRFTMENDFFKTPLIKAGITPYVPEQDEQTLIHEKTVEELENGVVKEDTKAAFLQIINRMVAEHHIEGLILGCTEHPMLIKPEDTSLLLFNTTAIHVAAIADLLI